MMKVANMGAASDRDKVRALLNQEEEPVQRELFELSSEPVSPRIRDEISMAMLWDMLPKYDLFSSSARYIAVLHEKNSARRVVLGEKTRDTLLHWSVAPENLCVELTIRPASIERQKRESYSDDKGKTRYKPCVNDQGKPIMETVHVYPGLREDRVEEALRYLVSHGRGFFKSNVTLTRFSINQLVSLLADVGCRYSWSEVRESLDILAGSICEVTIKDRAGKEVDRLKSPFLPMLRMATREGVANPEDEIDSACYAQLHPLVTQSITENFVRRSTYIQLQRIQDVLARHLNRFFRICAPSNISLSFRQITISERQVMADFGQAKEPAKKRARAMTRALEALKAHGTLKDFSQHPVYSQTDRRRMLDRQINCVFSDDFVHELVEANARRKKVQWAYFDTANKEAIEAAEQALSPEVLEVYEGLLAKGLKRGQSLDLLKRYSLDRLRNSLQLFQERARTLSPTIQSSSAYLLKIIENGGAPAMQPGKDLFDGMEPVESDVPTAPDEDRLMEIENSRILMAIEKLWPQWSEGDRRTFNRYGLSSPNTVSLLSVLIDEGQIRDEQARARKKQTA